MQVIFLDIDGVLNSVDFITKVTEEGRVGKFGTNEWWSGHINPERVQHLNKIIAESEAKVVISSTWRIGKSPERMQEILDMKGFEGEVIDCTTTDHMDCRGHQIQAWLDMHPETLSFVIIDDDPDMAELMPYLVKTTYLDWNSGGLREEHVDEALSILESNGAVLCEFCGEECTSKTPCLCGTLWS